MNTSEPKAGERVRDVHFTEDTLVDGIRYVNTGCWTETPSHYFDIGRDPARLQVWE